MKCIRLDQLSEHIKMNSLHSKTHRGEDKVLFEMGEEVQDSGELRDVERLSLNSDYHSIDIGSAEIPDDRDERHSLKSEQIPDDHHERQSLNSGHDSIDINELQLNLPQRSDWDDEIDSSSILYWPLCGSSFPRAEIIYLVQVSICFLIITCCLINLSLQIGNSNLWAILLASSLGYILPSPGLDRAKKFTAKKELNKI